VIFLLPKNLLWRYNFFIKQKEAVALKKLVVFLVLMTAICPASFAGMYSWPKKGEVVALIVCLHGSTAEHIRRGNAVSRAGNGGYFQKVRGVYLPIGHLYLNGKECYSFPSPVGRGWIYRDATGTHLSSLPPEDPLSCYFALEAGAVTNENGRAKSREEIAKYKERHRDLSRPRHLLVEKDGLVGNYYATGPLWKIAKNLEKDGVDMAVNVDGGSSTNPSQHVANFLIFVEEEEPPLPRPDCLAPDMEIGALPKVGCPLAAAREAYVDRVLSRIE